MVNELARRFGGGGFDDSVFTRKHWKSEAVSLVVESLLVQGGQAAARQPAGVVVASPQRRGRADARYAPAAWTPIFLRYRFFLIRSRRESPFSSFSTFDSFLSPRTPRST